MECSQCTHGARCITGPPSTAAAVVAADEELGNSVLLPGSQDREDLEEGDTQSRIHCNCEHYKCTGFASKKFCATNGVTYSNECYMRKEACQRQTSIYKLYDGHCILHCKSSFFLSSLSLSLSLTHLLIFSSRMHSNNIDYPNLDYPNSGAKQKCSSNIGPGGRH